MAIELMISDREIAPDSIPDLAIFKEYRLYCAVGSQDGKIVHALRLGFFSDEAAAEAVAGYLKAFFETPAVKRIGTEERERFAHRRLAPGKDGGDSGRHAKIELSSAPSAPATSLADLTARHRIANPSSAEAGTKSRR
ncbi:MAG: hypothetical protein JSR54_16150 [Proteobacteria bacterium]|nr:hypothetical protein [Pseudomonadota bacterium]